jgi:hypothetical protein
LRLVASCREPRRTQAVNGFAVFRCWAVHRGVTHFFLLCSLWTFLPSLVDTPRERADSLRLCGFEPCRNVRSRYSEVTGNSTYVQPQSDWSAVAGS